MKFKYLFFFILTINWFLSGCKINPTQAPTNWQIESTIVNSTPTISQQTPTVTPKPTLQPEEARKIIQERFNTISDCAAPCFWDITPNKTTLDEAQDIFSHLGLIITENNNVHFSVDDVLSGLISLDANDNLVNSVSVSIDTEHDLNETYRSWFAYSPESLIAQYGTPTKVEIIGSYVMDKVVFAESPKWYSMNIYFAKQNLIVYYEDGEFEPENSSYLACPLTNKFRYVKLWFGENPKFPPPSTYPLEEVSQINLEEFARLMKEKVDSACFELNEKIFN